MIAIMSSVFLNELSRLAVRRVELDAGETLFRVGNLVEALFFVVSGEIRLLRTLPNGFRLTLQRGGAGAILAEASLFSKSYHCDAVASEACVLGVVPLRTMEAALMSDPALARDLAAHLAHEVQRSRAKTEILSLRTVSERIEAWLALNDNTLPPKGRLHHLASEIGVTPEALYRALRGR